MPVIRSLLRLAFIAIAAAGLTAIPARAAVIQNGAVSLVIDASTGRLTGANHVQVLDGSYDVTFRNGRCDEVFGSCGRDHFEFDNEAAALAAANALLDQVFVDFAAGGVDYLFDSDPTSIDGCSARDPDCTTVIPYGIGEFLGRLRILSAFATNDVEPNLDGAFLSTDVQVTESLTGRTSRNFARFVRRGSVADDATVVPEPSAPLLFAMALILLAGLGRRRQQG